MRVIDTIDVIEGIDTIDFCCLDWDVVVVVAWLAVLDGRFFSKIFACRRVEPEGAGSSPARPTNKLKVES